MLNPVFRREIRTVLRTWKTFIAIALYVLILGGASGLYIMLMMSNSMYSGFNPQQSASLYTVLAGFQLGLILLIVPALTGGAISGERERQTLDLILVTKMNAFSIVTGKLLSSLLVVLLLIFASLPVFGVLLYYGGVSFYNLMGMFAFFMMTACMVGSISIFLSVLFRKTVLSIVLTYLIIIVLSLGTYILMYYFNRVLQTYFYVQNFSYTHSFLVMSLNPFTAFVSLKDSQLGTTDVMNMMVQITMYSDTKNYPFVPLWAWNLAADGVITAVFVTLGTLLIRPARRSRKYK